MKSFRFICIRDSTRKAMIFPSFDFAPVHPPTRTPGGGEQTSQREIERDIYRDRYRYREIERKRDGVREGEGRWQIDYFTVITPRVEGTFNFPWTFCIREPLSIKRNPLFSRNNAAVK